MAPWQTLPGDTPNTRLNALLKAASVPLNNSLAKLDKTVITRTAFGRTILKLEQIGTICEQLVRLLLARFAFGFYPIIETEPNHLP